EKNAPALSRETFEETIAPGLTHLTMHRGRVDNRLVYRVLAGTYRKQRDADARIRALQQAAISGTPIYSAGSYDIVVGRFSDRRRAVEMQERISQLEPSQGLRIQEIRQDISSPTGPWSIHVLIADPELMSVRVAHAYDTAIGVETTANLAARQGALAAINGGYYLESGLTRGDSQGVLMIEGRLLSEPDRGRAAVGFYSAQGRTRSLFGRLGLRSRIFLSGQDPIEVDGLNRARQENEIIVYTPEFHRTSLTSPGGAEVVVVDAKITEIRQARGSSNIPPAGYLISMGSRASDAHLAMFKVGAEVRLDLSLIPLGTESDQDWSKAEWIVGGGPLLLWRGRRIETPERESISQTFFLARHPRTAVGVRPNGTLLLVTVDGRQPRKSVGMTLRELTDLFLELGAESAMNLDGGGSTSMVIDGNTINSPSDLSGDRMNADALLVFARK
ncbi:MAG: phosphodiester glycosidase family protein, partial [Thermoanaerobaculia bacterium]